MDKERYFEKLCRAARWYLPGQEAEEVMADYRELLADSEGEDFGDPVQAVRLLVKPREYRRWVTVFVLLAAATLTVPVSGLCSVPAEFGLLVEIPVLGNLWSFFNLNDHLLAALPLLGTALAWLWFRRHGVRPAERVRFRNILPFLAAELLVLAGAWVMFWLLAAHVEILTAFFGSVPDGWGVHGLRLLIKLSGPLCGGLGVLGLIRARTQDRRWLAVYLLGLAAGGVCTAVLAVLTGFSLDITSADWWVFYARMFLGLTAAGLLGTGWALC